MPVNSAIWQTEAGGSHVQIQLGQPNEILSPKKNKVSRAGSATQEVTALA